MTFQLHFDFFVFTVSHFRQDSDHVIVKQLLIYEILYFIFNTLHKEGTMYFYTTCKRRM